MTGNAPVKLFISIHALREEGDDKNKKCGIIQSKFLSTPSVRRATVFGPPCVFPVSISIHALREEGDFVVGKAPVFVIISIHALREEGDSKNGELLRRFCPIIHESEQF